MDQHPDLSPQHAAEQLERTTSQVRRRGRWPAWLFLSTAVVTFAFVLLVGSGSHAVSTALSPLPSLLAVAILVVVIRQPVIGRGAQAINKPVVLASVLTAVVGLVIDQTVLPGHFTGWLVLVAALVVSPYFLGAALWLRR
jgi:hypothetical protein